MNASYVLIGSLVAPAVNFDRMWELALAYLLAVGVSAHSLDAMGPNKPWGDFLSRRYLLVLAIAALVPALVLGVFLALAYAPLLIPIGVVELFFLVTYNLEFFGGRFHSDSWFAISWGFLPVVAGYVVQTNTIAPVAIAAGLFGFATASVEINASRPYKALRKDPAGRSSEVASRLESILKGIVAVVLLTAGSFLAYRIIT
jgi:hypothetical protein